MSVRNNYPKIVCWRITSKCNRHCPFCFRSEAPDLGTKSVFKIIDNLAKNGVQGVGITGGEPLLRRDFTKILKYIHGKRLSICLATNADLYKKYSKQIIKYADVIGLPIEASSSEVHDRIRGKGSFENVLRAMDAAFKSNKKIYISTVVTPENVSDIVNIENLLVKYKDNIVYWKIYELIKYSYKQFQSVKNSVAHKIAKNEIKHLGKKIGRDKVLYLTSKNRSEASFIINPDGDAIVPRKKKNKTHDISLGNLLIDDTQSIFKKWDSLIDFKKYQCHNCALKNGCIKMNTNV